MNAKPIILVTGQPAALPIQCFLRGSGGTVPAVFDSNDVLSAAIIQHGQTAAVCVPIVAFYTANNTQSGFGQGQVEVSITTAQAVLLIASISYTLAVWRALASNPGVLELIARIPLVIEPVPV